MKLRGTKWFYRDDPADISDIEVLAEHLYSLLASATYIGEFPNSNGPVLVEGKALVERIDGLKIEIYSNEHPPPHFHVKIGGKSASFRLDNGEVLNGDIDDKHKKKVLYWYEKGNGRVALIRVWNETRPQNCVVGEYRESKT